MSHDVLKGFSAPALLALVHDLYEVSAENGQFLRGRRLPSDAGLEEYRARVIDALFPDPFTRKQVRVGEAERLIKHYRLSTGDQTGVVDLMLAMVEAGTEQTVDLGYGDETYFAALEQVLRSVVDALPSLPESAQSSMVQRLRQVAARAESERRSQRRPRT